MKGDMYERCIEIGRYIIDTNKTVREAAKHFEISKSTVHNDVTRILPKVDFRLAKKVRTVLDLNKAERHIRGGFATQEKYQRKKLQS